MMLILTGGEPQPALHTYFDFYARYNDMNMSPLFEESDMRRLCLMGSDALIWIKEPLARGDTLPLWALVEFLDYVPLHIFTLTCAAPTRGTIGYARWFRSYVRVMQQEMESEVFPLLTVTERVLDHFEYFGKDLWCGLMIDQQTSPLEKPETARRIFELAADMEVPLYLRAPLQAGPETELYHRLITEFDEVLVVLVPDKVTPELMKIWGQNDNVWLTLADLRTSEMRQLPRDHCRVIYSSGFPNGLLLVDHLEGENFENLELNTQGVTSAMERAYVQHRNFCEHWFGEEIFMTAIRKVFAGELPESYI